MPDELKYPNLIAEFPDEIVEEAIKAAQTSTPHFKQWMLEQCHEYAMGILALYHEMSMKSQLRTAYNLSSLENIDKLKEEQNEQSREINE